MICSIMQPTYIPWLGYFCMIDKVDAFVFLDSVKIEKCSWQVRNRVKGLNGEVMLTIPTCSGRNALICETVVDNKSNWKEKHLKTLRQYYSKAPAFGEVFEVLTDAYDIKSDKLADFNIHLIKTICERVGISAKFLLSSELDGIDGKKDELVVNICRSIDADMYLSTPGAEGYINQEKKGGSFAENDIGLYYLDYLHPVYPQMHGEFISHMGVYDLLFNVGFDSALSIIRSGSRPNLFYTDI